MGEERRPGEGPQGDWEGPYPHIPLPWFFFFFAERAKEVFVGVKPPRLTAPLLGSLEVTLMRAPGRMVGFWSLSLDPDVESAGKKKEQERVSGSGPGG